MASTSKDGLLDMNPSEELSDTYLPTNLQVFKHIIYCTRILTPKLTIEEAKDLISSKLENIWSNGNLTFQKKRIKNKIQDLYEDYRTYQKARHKTATNFFINSNKVFDISDSDLQSILQSSEKNTILYLPVNQIAERMQNLQLLSKSAKTTSNFSQEPADDYDDDYCSEEEEEEDEEEDEQEGDGNDATKEHNAEEVKKYVPGNISHFYAFKTNTSESTSQEASQDTNKSSQSSGCVYRPSKGRNYIKKGTTKGTIDVLTAAVVEVLDNCKISYRKAVQIVAAISHALGADMESLILNPSSFYRKRQEIRKKKAESHKKLFASSCIDFVIVHWDGKLLPDSPNDKKKVDRVPILVTAPGDIVQIIDVPKLDHGTGKLQGDALFNALDSWDLLGTVEAVCCDTTNSNLGSRKGAAVVLEKKLNKDLLYLACRHHIGEVILRAVFETKIEASKQPDVPIFETFREKWDSIDKSKFRDGLSQIHPDLLLELERIISFIENHLNNKQPRDDYRELLELCRIFLGKKNDVRFRKPGPCHHARWMSKAIYSLKMFLFRDEFNLREKETSFFEICQFIVFIYIKVWYTATDAIEAPYNDLNLVKKLQKYKAIDESIAKAGLDKISNHLWYLSPECSAFAFFDDRISIDKKKEMILALKKDNIIPKSDKKIPKNKVSILMHEEIDYFVNVESLQLFERFNLKKDFLKLDPSTWPTDDSYKKNKEIINSLRVVNDVSERAVRLTTEYNNCLTKDENQKQYLLQVVANYKRDNPDSKKESLVKKYKTSNSDT